MKKSSFYLSLVVLFAVAGLLWLMIPNETPDPGTEAANLAKKSPPNPAQLDDDESVAGLEASDTSGHRASAEANAKAGEAPVEKLDPDSKEFFRRVDDVLPAHLYAEAAKKCWRYGLDRNQKIKVSYRLHAENGEISVRELKIMDSTIKEPSMASCLTEAVQAAAWSDEEMPDYDDEDELVIRLGGLKKHLGEDQDDSEEGGFRPSDQPRIEDDGEGAVTVVAPEGQTGG